MKVSPRWARAMLPRKGLPIWSGSGCVQRMPPGVMIVTKSTSVSFCTLSAYGWSSAVGSGEWMAARTDGASAIERATAVA